MSKRKEASLSPDEWQARHDAACAIVARKYCDGFAFWRDCKYRPCRSARRCSGNPVACLQKRCASVPYDARVAAQLRMAAEAPANADRFLRLVHNYPPSSICFHPKNQKARDKSQAEGQTKSQIEM